MFIFYAVYRSFKRRSSRQSPGGRDFSTLRGGRIMIERRPVGASPNVKPTKERTLPIDKDAFAERLWSAIKRSGLTYKETARRAQEHLPPGARISDVSVWSYAKGRSLPRRMTHVEALGKVLGIETQELLGSEEHAATREGLEAIETPYPPEVHVEDLGGGYALIRINQQVPWPVALEVLRLVKGPDTSDFLEDVLPHPEKPEDATDED
jgi:transcriptional regulator with XRE-family HTH domain